MIHRHRFVELLLLGIVLLLTSCTLVIQKPTAQPDNTSSDLPLSVGNKWVYQHTRYTGFNASEIMTFTCTITETVVNVASLDSLITVKIQREVSAEQLVSEDVQAAKPDLTASSQNYWLVIDTNRIYRTDFTPDLPHIQDTGELELAFPLQVGKKWYLNQAMADRNPDMAVDSMLRKVVMKRQLDLSIGRSEGCYALQEIVGGSTFEKWFCPGIGWVDRRSDHSGTPYGEHEVLVAFSQY
ncbi:MAG: hypothetical protein P1S60_03700 [Anaerolineae bacterium]|nr:hypothetical protein [Anaerolineae bacterium]